MSADVRYEGLFNVGLEESHEDDCSSCLSLMFGFCDSPQKALGVELADSEGDLDAIAKRIEEDPEYEPKLKLFLVRRLQAVKAELERRGLPHPLDLKACFGE